MCGINKMLLLVLQGIYFYVCIKFDIQAASGTVHAVASVVCLNSLTSGLYVLSHLLFVCVQFDIQAESGALCAVMSVLCLCTV